ncbi:MAG: DUF3090 family protein [Actinobacteria bacterium]|nr:DUF3090 family protein [Actinomycetota bacterium]
MELGPVDRITADAVGEPGDRTFYIQARKDDRLVTVLVEKQQVQLLSASILEILARVGKETGQGPEEDDMGLESPVEPDFRAGRMSIGYQEDRDLLVLELEETLPEEEAEAREAERLLLWATREQMLSLSRHGALVCARGRPTCQLCGNPMDPEGHWCPAMNGHQKTGEA